MTRETRPAFHVYHGIVEARLRYPADDPPKVIEVRGTRWIREDSSPTDQPVAKETLLPATTAFAT